MFSDGAVDNTLAAHGTPPAAGYREIEPECYLYTQPGPHAGDAVEVWWNEARRDQWVLGSDASRQQAASMNYTKQATLGYGLRPTKQATQRSRGDAAAATPNALALAFKVSF